MQFVIQLKQSEFRLPDLERHTEKLFPFYLSYDKPCGELARGENCIKIISQDKSNSLGIFLEVQREIKRKEMSRNGISYAEMWESISCEILLFIGPRKKYGFADYLSCCVSLNQYSDCV